MNVLQEGLEIARGYFIRVEYTKGNLLMEGWLLLPNKKFDNYQIFIDKQYVCDTEVIANEGVAAGYPYISHARYSYFNIELNRSKEEMSKLIVISVVGMAKGEQTAKIETCFFHEASVDIIDTPIHLMRRVASTDNTPYFRASRFKTYYDYFTLLSMYLDIKSIKKLLDWGCGCGRTTSVFHKLTNIPEIDGCDVDAEAIEWCKKNISNVNFSVISVDPPTAYPDNSFDLVIGQSVLTHLTKNMQLVWLKEMKRILKPGGLLLASVHGEFAAYFCLPETWKEILKQGIYDEMLDSTLDGITPVGYYRGTLQSQEYTRKVFSTYFEILEYKERGSSNHQDIVVMKKRLN